MSRSPDEQAREVLGAHVGEFRRHVLAPLGRLRRWLRLYLLVEGLAAAAAVLWVVIGAQVSIDFLLRPPADIRGFLLAGGLCAVGAVLWRRLIAPLAVPLPDAGLALLLERRWPALDSGLVSAVEFLAEVRRGTAPWAHRSPAMVHVLLHRVQAAAADLDWGCVLNHRRAGRRAATTAGCLLLAIGAAYARPEAARLWLRRSVLLRDDPWPQRTRMEVQGLKDGRILCPRGDDLTLSAIVLAGYETPRQAFVEIHRAGRSERRQMVRLGRRFECVLAQVTESMRCRVRGNDEVTAWFDVQVADRPAVSSVAIHVVPPKYAGVPAYDLREGLTVAEVLPGSEVWFRARTNKPIARARLLRGQTPIEEATKVTPTEWVGRDRPERPAAYWFELTDEMGLTNRSDRVPPLMLTVRHAADRPPKVSLVVRGASDLATPEAVLPMQVEITDTYGIATAELVMEPIRSGGGGAAEPRIERIEGFEAPTKAFSRSLSRALGPLGLAAGDRVSLYAEAKDYDDVRGPNVGKSAVVSLRIVTREELLNELARREQQQRQELESCLRAQEELYADTLEQIRQARTRPADEGPRREFARLERRQRQVAGRVDAVRRRIEGILAEMQANQVMTPPAAERLGVRIAGALARLTREGMAEAADLLSRPAREAGGEALERIGPVQARVVAEMRAVLAEMLRYEGFQEVVSLLREILTLQGDVNEQTRRRLAEEVEAIFGKP